ncbi:Uncharacterized protein ALO56_05266 [Pseudomonas viridiflava]|uniref:Uncharacterized protein n=1 Tax=Pseudomonas syringae pv. ribicola TaxID=55398 RepID=A0A0P9ZB26_PSESI|nr:Uncharacterized protein ALO47_05308 [Pseudomonas syringae pv. ribicola]KPZ24176.1 Uncharacterized protein ALO56_05266 [Pseudomonas viridiflava]
MLQVPAVGDLFQGMQCLGFDASGLFHIDVVALHQRRQRTFAHVFVMMATHQVIQHTFTQRTFAVVHALEFEGVENRFQNRQTRRENRAAVGFDAVEVDLLDVAQFEQFALEPGQAFGVDLACAIAIGLERHADRANGAGRTDGFIPLQAMQRVLDAHDFQAGGGVGLRVAGRCHLAVAEVALSETHAAHLQAFAQQRLETLTDDELGTAAADIGHEAFAGGVRQCVGDAQINEACFFAAGDDFHRVAEDFFGAVDEVVAVTGFAQGVGAHDAHGAERQAVDQLGEALEAVEAPLHRFFSELALFGNSGCQLHLLAQALKNANFALIGFCHNHMEAVGAQVDSGDQ